MTNLAAALEKDPVTFRKLKRIVTMGGSIERGFDDLSFPVPKGPVAEYNIAMDPVVARKVYAAGVPVFELPLDSTQLRLGDVQRMLLFTAGDSLSDALALLYQHWTRTTRIAAPIMFDVLAVAYVIQPDFCPVTPMHIEVDGEGLTKRSPGKDNTSVCLHSDEERFMHLFLSRLLAPSDVGRPVH